uniref:Uncharacterized protein n=1 Tax=Anguilla anguilla TaxID=7936 RepID=A0A0E9T3S5_ANGAN
MHVVCNLGYRGNVSCCISGDITHHMPICRY